MKIIYLHGFASTGTSEKVDAMRAAFGPDAVLAPDLPVNLFEIHDILDRLRRREGGGGQRFLFVGTSFGGFLAMYFANLWFSPWVAINPVTDPKRQMAPIVGRHVNYNTGAPFDFTEADLALLVEAHDFLKSTIRDMPAKAMHVFAAEDDDVIPCRDFEALVPKAAHVTITPDGGHRYNTTWPLVVDYLQKLIAKGPELSWGSEGTGSGGMGSGGMSSGGMSLSPKTRS